jgi:hypothetical protein
MYIYYDTSFHKYCEQPIQPKVIAVGQWLGDHGMPART